VAAAATMISVVLGLACKYLHLFVLFTEAVHSVAAACVVKTFQHWEKAMVQ
jgi:hypothetical protein